MNRQMDNVRKVRTFLLAQLDDLSSEQLNRIPDGFNNNIIWNIGHMIAAQQGICYIRAGVPPVVEEQLILNYKPGTKPAKSINDEEVTHLKSLLLSTLDQMEADLEGQLFDGYKSWTIRYGVEITNIDEAIDILLFHEGYHQGAILALKKLV